MENNKLKRRYFIKAISATGLSLALPLTPAFGSPLNKQKVRIGVIGTGGRGTSLLRNLLHVEGVEVPALCDPLSGISIAKNGPAEFPDFTRGKWEKKEPYFAK